jgi:ADP-heptose:LPS heptosyltransferase
MNKKILKNLDGLLRQVIRFLPRNKRVHHVPKKILVIKLSAMGDAFCLMPTIKYIKKSTPFACIDWLTTKRTNPGIFEDIKEISNILILPTTPFKLINFLYKFIINWGQYDLIIDFDQYYLISELLAYTGRASIGFSTRLKGSTFSLSLPYDPVKNEKKLFLELAALSNSEMSVQDCEFFYELKELSDNFPSEFLLGLIRKLKKISLPIVVVYPGSSVNAIMRRWAPERYLDLVYRLSSGCVVIIAGGPDELEINNLFSGDNDRIYNLINKLTIKDWLWLFKYHADLFVGNDAGMLHLAESQGLPSVSLFGPNIGSKWGSLNPSSIVVDVELDCRPCIKTYLGIIPQACSRGDNACMNNISIEMVISAVSGILNINFAS